MLNWIDTRDEASLRARRGQAPLEAKGGGKGSGGGGKGGGKGGRPVNGPSTTDNASGKNRGNNPPSK
ncbi:MAG: hypothetical protein OXT09_23840 [Myxococcales bacterium]|nr:hypothetical protein [Myxococcales bacterium]